MHSDAGINKNTCIQIVGNWENLPAKLRHRMANLMHKTRHLKPFLLKLAIAYTGNLDGFKFYIHVFIHKQIDI